MRVLGAHQPNYLPWIGYFEKLARVDCFVLADDVQFTSQSYINRAHIKTPQGKQLLTIPVLTSGRGPQAIKEIEVDRNRHWRQKHWKSLRMNYANTAYFEQFTDWFDGFYRKDWRFLVDINIALITFLCQQFAIDTPVYRSSELDLHLTTSTGRIINMVKRLDCNQYISGRGASLQYLEAQQFDAAGIGLLFNDFDHPRYPQRFGPFVSHLSAIDLLFNCGPGCQELFQQRKHEMQWV